MVDVRPVRKEDSAAWLQLRSALWPDGTQAEHREEIERFFAGEFHRGPWVVLLAESEEGRVVGLAEVSIRPYAEGCETHRVAYLEGWFVSQEARKLGVGSALLAAAEEWGREQGCSEFASDADPENAVSVAAHRAFGFADMGLVRCFRKEL